MQRAIVPMPVTIEQAAVVRNMSRKERQRLLELVPELRETPNPSLSPQAAKDQALVEQLRRETLAALDGRFLIPDEPFLDAMTLGAYLDLPDAERTRLWDRWEQDGAVSGRKSMSTPTRCLLDKVSSVIRYTLDGMLNLSLGRALTGQQVAALRLFQSAATPSVQLFIAPASANILGRLQSVPRFAPLIQVFLSRRHRHPTRSFTRWSRRVREFGFAPEDARMLALGSFCTNQDRDILGMRCFITYDHPLVNLWNQSTTR